MLQPPFKQRYDSISKMNNYTLFCYDVYGSGIYEFGCIHSDSHILQNKVRLLTLEKQLNHSSKHTDVFVKV
ncbi:hypothetical protein HanRHA438_Chr08g0365031 [Helianthus annuus]|uniref:Uncharacterized protein n=1 Tax=Helianthus annuus TaxID=4232 RepID=A0A9K3NEK3_HELAN|nr:hypothetical protein HanXRQr2_Chr08g0352861 [Helianthus annuus]KAJ0554581.1 hypothetical protein HanHA89_Chr08g0309551 [Helianthus annuus]KAJ0723375.1 hypothetical protein HanOQP8_Chr08g0297421 [Helianthus annuus]KAJ0899149.1 hypothetical protein HanRHA438_Chr08g0365031 [Helianthus annuus]KAJ0902749.1 hypothetical protein HanPSC8_Chr08g0340751 [Helianthus annuus]